MRIGTKMDVKSFLMMVILFLGLIPKEAESVRMVEIIRAGEGEIGIRGSLLTGKWPEGFSLPSPSGKYQVKRLNHDSYPPPDPEVLSSWNPEKLTSLRGLPRGTRLDRFKFIVHGLELETMVDLGKDPLGNPTAFDKFVRATLNPSVPLEGDFVPFYPYFFHKKTVISASVISETLTATFGRMGFILNVPTPNFIFSATTDAHTPVDSYFYTRGPLHASCPHASFGETLMQAAVARYALLPLNKMVPAEDQNISSPSQPYVIPIERDQKKSTIETLRYMGHPEDAIRSVTAMLEKTSMEELERAARTDPSVVHPKDTSWYNEIAINPSRDRAGTVTSATIRGIFIRHSPSQLDTLKSSLDRVAASSPHMKALLKIADAFDLPIVFIGDEMEYYTSFPT